MMTAPPLLTWSVNASPSQYRSSWRRVGSGYPPCEPPVFALIEAASNDIRLGDPVRRGRPLRLGEDRVPRR